jgi:membrane associated rhomboid family serine protease
VILWIHVVLILFLCVALYFAYRSTTADERGHYARYVFAVVREARQRTAHGRSQEPFHEALRARTPRTIVTPVLVALYAIVFSCMLVGAGSLSDPETLTSWGGNFGPRTTNGEWWRLVATTFVHVGVLHLLVNVAGLFQLGLVLERLVGPAAFALTYVAAAVCAGLVSLALHPVTASTGASAAIFGLYGLLVSSFVWSIRHRSTVTIPLKTLKRLVPAAAVFFVYTFVTAGPDRPVYLTGLLAGLACGIVTTRTVAERKPRMHVLAGSVAALIAIAVAFAAPLRGMADVKPEIERVLAVEGKTASAYQTEVERFKNGRINAEKLAQVVDRSIGPELRAARARLRTLKHVPHEQQPLVAAADEYLRLRDESWQLRSEALHKSHMPTLRNADKTERASLEAYQKIITIDVRRQR